MLRAFSRGTVRTSTTCSARPSSLQSKWNTSQSADAEHPSLGTPNARIQFENGLNVAVYPPAKPPAVFQLPQPAESRPYISRVTHNPREYPLGKPWQSLPLPFIHPRVFKRGQLTLAGPNDDPFEDLDLPLLFDKDRSLHQGVDLVVWRRDLLRILGNTQSHAQGWSAYHALVSVPFTVPHRHLNRLVRLMALERSKTRLLFSRLLDVLTTIHQSGWKLQTYQWNALIDNAGKGFRKARPADFKTAFTLFVDLVSSRPPGTTFSAEDVSLDEGALNNPRPDIHTYTTLINHAINTRNKIALEQTTSLLKASGIRPSRITHLVLLKFHTYSGNLDGVRASLARMHQEKKELGIDGVNACIWAFSRHRRLDMVLRIYRLLRHNLVPETLVGPNDIYSARRQVDAEHIEITAAMLPNEVTYTLIAQASAYHGHLREALQTFADMLSSDNIEIGAPLHRAEDGHLKPSPYSPTLPIFRALFLGFYRHGVPTSAAAAVQSNNGQPWVPKVLNHILDVFLALPKYIEPSGSTIYWLLVAFRKTSNGDREVLQIVWTRIRNHFSEDWGTSHRIEQVRRRFFDNKT
ncbi:hypothetical protein C8F01DRAFT_978104 [Mycena amicta]|nr:hypothetical protein C8F01DRAFT_978104 [Mycena amicta]